MCLVTVWTNHSTKFPVTVTLTTTSTKFMHAKNCG